MLETLTLPFPAHATDDKILYQNKTFNLENTLSFYLKRIIIIYYLIDQWHILKIFLGVHVLYVAVKNYECSFVPTNFLQWWGGGPIKYICNIIIYFAV